MGKNLIILWVINNYAILSFVKTIQLLSIKGKKVSHKDFIAMQDVNKRYIYLITAISALGGFLFGFDTSVIADIHIQASQQLSLSQWQWSKIVGSGVLGCIFGILLSGIFADRLSRRLLLKLVAIGFVLATALCAQAHHFTTLLGGRFFIGVCIGIASYITPLFIAEIAPAAQRGRLVLLNGLALTFGQAIAYLVGYLLNDIWPFSWRIIIWIGAIPAALLFMGMQHVPHSPRWLFKQFGREEARNTLQKIRATPAQVQAELDEIHQCVHGYQSRRLHLWKPPVVHVLLAGILLGLFQQFSGINAILYYGPLIFTTAGFTSFNHALLATFCLGFINFIFTGITLLSVDRLGRRNMLVGGTLMAAVALLATSVLFNAQFLGCKYWLLLSFTIYIIGYCISVGSLFWVIIAEIYPLAIRAQAMSIATLVQWAGNFVVAISFLDLYSALKFKKT